MKRYVFVRAARNVLIPSKNDVPRPHQEIWTSVLQIHTETIDETPGTSVFVSVRATGLFPNRTGLNWIWSCENLRVASLARLEVWSETPQNTKFMRNYVFSWEKKLVCFGGRTSVPNNNEDIANQLQTKKHAGSNEGFTLVSWWSSSFRMNKCFVSANKFCLVRLEPVVCNTEVWMTLSENFVNFCLWCLQHWTLSLSCGYFFSTNSTFKNCIVYWHAGPHSNWNCCDVQTHFAMIRFRMFQVHMSNKWRWFGRLILNFDVVFIFACEFRTRCVFFAIQRSD